MTIDVTLASAGTGKTSFLVDCLVDAIAKGVAPERIMATTFTVSAAAELVERCRARLIADGNPTAAIRLLQARIGTTHAVCGRIAEDFAFELALSPTMRVLSDADAAEVFAKAADAVIARYAGRLDPLAEAFGARPLSWRDDVRRIVDLARANSLDAGDLALSADRSALGVFELLPTSDTNPLTIDEALATAVGRTLAAIDGVELGPRSRELVAALLSAGASLASGRVVPWPLWAELAGAQAATADAGYFGQIAAAASNHNRHPRLREDIEAFIRLVFACATEAMVAYQDVKAAAGQVDFTDQERLALDALAREDVRASLADEIDLVLVDELQDASPLEIEIFGALARIAPSSIWVGDLKQQIYSFRGGDAALVKEAVDAALAASGRPLGVLSTSRRARPKICSFINDVFGPAFDAAGLGAGSRFNGFEREPDAIGRDPLSVWFIGGGNRRERAAALAGAIVGVLAEPAAWPVRADGAGQLVRPLEPRDVAILCRLNAEVDAIAAALARAGVPVAIERCDLMHRPEAELVTAALRWIANSDDRLALVELVRLAAGDAAQDVWLEALATDDAEASLLALLPFGDQLRGIRLRRRLATPLELLDSVIVDLGVMNIAARWGEGGARLEVIDALRGRAAAYVETCRRGEASATLSGLVAALADSGGSRSRPWGGAGVTVTTFHRAKGAEWAMVILSSPDVDLPERFGGPVVERDDSGKGVPTPAGRWIRFWPKPYAARTSGVMLHEAMRASRDGVRAAERDRAEALRLLYVAFSRARDHLVITCSTARSRWLRALDLDDVSRLVLPMYENRPIVVDGTPHPAEFRVVKVTAAQSRPRSVLHLPMSAAMSTHPPLRLRPSEATGSHRIVARPLGDRLPLADDPDMVCLGEACHAFFAVDAPSDEDRSARAADILARWDVPQLGPGDLVEAADRLWRFLGDRFPGLRWRREVPLFARLGAQQVSGRLDLLGEGEYGFVLIDHKSFVGQLAGSDARASAAASQLDLYRRAMIASTGQACLGVFVHLPLMGRIAEVVLAI